MASRRRGHQWQPIADLPADWTRWRSPELGELVTQWHRRRAALPESDVRAFLGRLVRSWSIETGILERIYTLDESVTRTLVEMGFDAAFVSHGSSDLPAGRLLAILEDHQRVAEGLFAFVSGKRELSTSYAHELHAELLRHQDTVEAIDSLGMLREIPVLEGHWKQLPNNPGDLQSGQIRHEYCPPVQVASEMDRLLQMHRAHTEVPFEIEAAWLHHRFTQIHPYQDGNGRVARSLATLVCLRAGSLPLLIDRSQKGAYIQALEAADLGDLGPLIGLFRGQQQRALLQAIQLDVASGAQPRDAAEVLKDAARKLREKLVVAANGDAEKAWKTASVLRQLTEARLTKLCGEINALGLGARAVWRSNTDSDQDHLLTQVGTAARNSGYEPELAAPKLWMRLKIVWGGASPRRNDLVISFHAVANTSREVLAAVAFLIEQESPLADALDAVTSTQTVSRVPFTFMALARHAETERLFEVWLEEVVVGGLDAWRKRI